MKDERKAKKWLIDELSALRKEIAELKNPRRESRKDPDGGQNFKALAENANDGILISVAGRYVYANRRAVEITGYSLSKLLQMTIEDITHPKEYPVVSERYQKRLAGKHAPGQYETVIVHQDGRNLPIELTAARTTWHGRSAGLAIIRDVSQRKEEEEKYQVLAESSPLGLFIIESKAGKIAFANTAAIEITGYSAKELGRFSPDRWSKMTHPQDRKAVADRVQRILSGQRTRAGFQFRLIRKDGTVRWVETNSTPITYHGKAASQTVIVDITERKQAEEKLKLKEQLYRAVVQEQTELICRYTPDGILTFVNEAYCCYFGRKHEDLIGRRFSLLIAKEDRQKVMDNIAALSRKRPVQTHEQRTLGPEGEVRWQQWTNRAIFDQGGQLVEYQAVGRDITELKQAEEKLQRYSDRLEEMVAERTAELKKSKDYLDEVFNNIHEGIGIVDEKEKILFCNPAFGEIFEQDMNRLIGGSLYDLFPPEAKKIIKEQTRERKKGGISTYEIPLITAKGNRKWLLVTASPRYDESGRYRGAFGAIMDITSRVQAEEELKESKERLQIIFDYAPEAYYLTDIEGRFIDGNKAAEEMSGYDKEDLVGQTVVESGLLPGDEIPKALKILQRNIRGAATGPVEFTIQRKDSRSLTVEITSYPVNVRGELFILNIARDITERKQYDQKLQLSEENFRTTFEQVAVGMAHVALDGYFIRVNQKFCDIVGYSRAELLQQRFQDITHPNDLETNLNFARQLLNGDIQQLTMEKRYIHQDGYPVWVHLTSTLIRKPSGDPDYFICIVEDIGVRKWTEEELIRSEERHKILFEYAPDGYFLIDINGQIRDCNRMAEEVTGYTKKELSGKNLLKSDLLPDDQLTKAAALLEELGRGRPIGSQELTLIRKNGEQLFTEISAFPGEIERQIQIFFIARDITDRKKRERQQQIKTQLMDQLRKTLSIDDCLQAGCQAIHNAGLFRRAVLTLHNQEREITNLGQVGLDRNIVAQARKASPPDEDLRQKILEKKFQVSHSYFIPVEAGLSFKKTPRYIRQKTIKINALEAWRSGDELFIPVMDKDGNVEGYLSVDTPFNGRRPDLHTILFLEDIVDIVARQTHEMKNLMQLKESGETAQALMNATTDSAFLIDTEGYILAVNEAAAQRLGRAVHELIGVSGITLFDSKTATNRQRKFQEAIRNKKPIRFQDERDGIIFDTTMFPILDPLGKVTRVALFGRDITEETRSKETLSHSEQQYRELVELLPQIVFELDTKGNFLTVNSYGFELTGYTQKDIDRGLNVLHVIAPEDRERAQMNIRKVLKGENFEDHEYSLVTRQGRAIPVLVYSNCIQRNGKVIGLRGIVLDITTLKKTELALRESEQTARAFLNAYTDPAALIEPKGKIVDLNSEMTRRLGRGKDGVIGTNIFEMFPRQVSDLRKKKTQEAIASRQPVRFEEENKGFFFDTTICPVCDDHGNVSRLAVFAQDITDRKKMEDALRESEEKFRGIAENMPDAIFTTDRDGRLTYVSPTVKDLLGFPAKECVGKLYHMFLKHSDVPLAINRFTAAAKGQTIRTLQLDMKRKDKTIVSTELSATPIRVSGKIIGTQGVIRDITERIHARQEIEKTWERYRNIVNLAPDASITIDMKGLVTSCNRMFLKQFGLTEDDILNKSFWDSPVMNPSRKNEHIKLFKNILRSGAPKPFEVEWTDDKGKTHHLEIRIGFLREGRKKTGLQAILRDITQQKESHTALEQSEARFRNLLEMAPDSIVSFDTRGVITSCNRAALEVLGFDSANRLIGKHFSRLSHVTKADIGKFNKLFAAVLAGKQVPPVVFATRRRDGTKRWAEGRYSVLKENGKVVGILAIIRDITERKREEEIHQALDRISTAVHTSEDLGQFYRTIHQELRKFLRTKNISISLYDREKHMISVEYYVDEKDHFEGLIPAGKSLTAYMIKNNKPLLLTNEQIRELKHTGTVKPLGAATKVWMGVPLKVSGKTIGALVANDYQDANAFDKRDLELLEFVSDYIALSIERKRTMDLLESSEELFRTLADHSPHMIYVNRFGSIIYANKMCQQVFGIKRESFYALDFNFLTLVAPESQALVKRNYARHSQGQEVKPYECTYVTRRGRKFRALNITRLTNYQGQPAILGILTEMD